MSKFKVDKSGDGIKVSFENGETVSWSEKDPFKCSVTDETNGTTDFNANMATGLSAVDTHAAVLSYLELFMDPHELVMTARALEFNTTKEQWSVKATSATGGGTNIVIVDVGHYVTYVTGGGGASVLVKNRDGTSFYWDALTNNDDGVSV